MVSYQQWTSAAFEACEEQGADTSDQEIAQDIISVAADVWNDHKDEIQGMALEAAKDYALREIAV